MRHRMRYLASCRSGESWERGIAGLLGGKIPPETTPVSSSTMPATLLGRGWEDVLNFSPDWWRPLSSTIWA